MKKFIVCILIVLTAALLAMAMAGCGGSNSESSSSGGSTGGGAQAGQAYSLNQPISFGGGEFTFTSAESLTQVAKRFEKSEVYTPKNGKYVVVYYTFKGNSANEKMGVDSAIFRLQDSTGKSWTMDVDTSNMPASDLAGTKKLDIPSMQMWSNPEPKNTLVMFDVPSDASGFTINLVKAAEGGKGVVTEATVPLGF